MRAIAELGIRRICAIVEIRHDRACTIVEMRHHSTWRQCLVACAVIPRLSNRLLHSIFQYTHDERIIIDEAYRASWVEILRNDSPLLRRNYFYYIE